jgi:hypothetical protein
MTGVATVNFSVRHVTAIGFPLRKVERQVAFASEDEKPRLLLAHPSLPTWG